MTNKEIFDVFRKRYPQINVEDYRPFDPIQVSGKQVITIWTDKGDVILFLPNGDEPNCRMEANQMLNAENQSLCWDVLVKNGCEAQRWMLLEECSELQKAVCKLNRYPCPLRMENFKEELVDVIVMCQQMLLDTDMDMDEVNKRANKKLKRALGV